MEGGRWYLFAYPVDRSLKASFDTSLEHYLSGPASGRREVVVMKPDGSSAAVWVILDDENVEYLYWCSDLASEEIAFGSLPEGIEDQE